MKVEISKAQKEALGQKISLCVDFLKKEVQPHLVKGDKLMIPMGEILDLCITSKEIYVVKTTVTSLVIDFYRKTNLVLEKPARKKVKNYICDVYPELAVDFLSHWGKARDELIDEVAEKKKKVADLDVFVDKFKL